jgi:small-conductance mechanosensitive channel
VDPNPFAALSLIVAPAILTNASSVLAMSTSNRLARAVDRARELSRELERDEPGHDRVRVLRDLGITETRALLLLRVLSSFYIALASFALATLVSLVGAALTSAGQQTIVNVFEGLGIAAGIIAVGALMHGALLLVRETRLAVGVLQERANAARAQRSRPE